MPAMANYSNIEGVRFSEWGPESDPENPRKDFKGEVEEMYFGKDGNLVIIIVHPDGDTVTDIQIPVLATSSWNKFVESLPTWDNE